MKLTQFAIRASKQGSSPRSSTPHSTEPSPKLVKDSRAAFSKLGESRKFDHFQVTDLRLSKDGTFEPVSLLSNFGDDHDEQVQNLTSMTDSSLYRVLEKTAAPFGWQVGADHGFVGGDLEKLAIADRKISDFLSGFDIRYGYSIPVYDPQGGRALVNYFESNGDMADHYPGLMFETTRLFEQLFSMVETDLGHLGHQITQVQKTCLSKLASGMSSGEIGHSMGLSPHAIEAIMASAVLALNARSTAHAVALAISERLIEV